MSNLLFMLNTSCNTGGTSEVINLFIASSDKIQIQGALPIKPSNFKHDYPSQYKELGSYAHYYAVSSSNLTSQITFTKATQSIAFLPAEQGHTAPIYTTVSSLKGGYTTHSADNTVTLAVLLGLNPLDIRITC